MQCLFTQYIQTRNIGKIILIQSDVSKVEQVELFVACGRTTGTVIISYSMLITFGFRVYEYL